MFFKRTKQNPAIYLSETTQYVNDLQRITLLRDKCKNEAEIANYDRIIHCMQEVVVFMNSLTDKERTATGLPAPVE